MIRRALNALKCVCIICRWVMRESASTHDPYDPSKKTDPFDPLTHRPIVYSAGLRQFRYGPSIVQQDAREAARRAGPSATCDILVTLPPTTSAPTLYTG